MPLPTLLTQHIARRPQRIALLQHIAEQGSITRAAKSAGISYKAAWDAIDELNNLAQTPLVERSVGGKGGGGQTSLQAYAMHRPVTSHYVCGVAFVFTLTAALGIKDHTRAIVNVCLIFPHQATDRIYRYLAAKKCAFIR